jgi:hypothetical protein
MKTRRRTQSRPAITFGKSLGIEQLTGLAAELQKVRHHPPLTQRQDGKYEGDILGFVKGLRLSARVIYFLRERLSGTELEVSWGHLLDGNDQSCSPECDVIIHSKGHTREWNGHSSPIMNFKFIEATRVKAIVSCKSRLNTIDTVYPRDLKRFGVNNIFLFAECCLEGRFKALRKKARQAGYKGLWCLYFTQDEESGFKTDESMYVKFGEAILDKVK